MTTSRTRTIATAAAWTAAGAIGATALTGIALAADSSTATPTPSPSSTSAPAAPEADGQRGGPGMGPGMGRGPGRGHGDMLGGPGGPVLHGDLTVKDEDGAVKQVRVQKGTVQSVSSTSLTVTSEDGYTTTWTINGDTEVRRDRDDAAITDITTGDTVMVRGPLSGDTATAAVVRALSPEAAAEAAQRGEERRQMREDFKEFRKQREGQTTDQPSNSSSSASEATYLV